MNQNTISKIFWVCAILFSKCRGESDEDVEWCELNLNSTGNYVKGINSQQAMVTRYEEFGVYDIEFTFEITNIKLPCKFSLHHDKETTSKILTWKSAVDSEWKLSEQYPSAIMMTKTVPLNNQCEYEGMYTLQFKNNVTAQLNAICEKPKNMCELNLNSTHPYVKGIFSELASVILYEDHGEYDIEFTFEVTNITLPCKFSLHHEKETTSQFLTWNIKTDSKWTLSEQYPSAIKMTMTVPLINQCEYEGLYTLEFKNNVTTQFYAICKKTKNISDLQDVPRFENHSFFIDVKNHTSLKTCIKFNQVSISSMF